MDKPLVSVFIPVYNSEDYIKDALNSIVTQTYTNLEIIIVDDCSTDQSIEIINSFQDSRIRLIRNEENKGIPYNRNLGLNESKGKYMAIMDADDIAMPNRIEEQVAFMEKHQDIDAIGTYYEMFGSKVSRTFKPKYISPEEIKVQLLFFSQIGNPTAMVRLETIKKHQITYNPEYFVAQDYDMWVQISKVGKLHILPDVLLKYRTGHSNITKKSQEEKAVKRKKIIDSIHKDILEFYRFNLTDKELIVYNEFFNDNSSEISKSSLEVIATISKKMIEQNRVNHHFKEDLFIKIMQDAVFFAINNHKLNLMDKLALYNHFKVSKDMTTIMKEMGFVFLKHMYRVARS